MLKLILPPVFAVSERQGIFEDSQIKYPIWMGPSLEHIQELYQKTVRPQLEITKPRLLSVASEEVFARIIASYNKDEAILYEGITLYNEQHGESAVLLCVLKEQLF